MPAFGGACPYRWHSLPKHQYDACRDMSENPPKPTPLWPFVARAYVLLCVIAFVLMLCARIVSDQEVVLVCWWAAGSMSFVIGFFLIVGIIIKMVLTRRADRMGALAAVLAGFLLGGLLAIVDMISCLRIF